MLPIKNKEYVMQYKIMFAHLSNLVVFSLEPPIENILVVSIS